MIEQTQAYFHKPEEGQIGDCWRTCVACVLNISKELIPHYYQEFWMGTVDIAPQVQAATNKFLSNRYGLKYVEYPIEANMEQLRIYITHYYKDHPVIIGCNSKHGGHSVVMMNEDYIWDPSIDKSGCVGPMKDGYFWLGFLVKTS
jgi:hypothetical protein